MKIIIRIFSTIFFTSFALLFLLYPISIVYYKIILRSEINSFEVLINYIASHSIRFIEFLFSNTDGVTISNSLQLVLALAAVAYSAPVYEKIKEYLTKTQIFVQSIPVHGAENFFEWKLYLRNTTSHLQSFDLDLFFDNHEWKSSFKVSNNTSKKIAEQIVIVENRVSIKKLFPEKWLSLKVFAHDKNAILIYKNGKKIKFASRRIEKFNNYENIQDISDAFIEISKSRLNYILVYVSVILIIFIGRIIYLHFK